MTNEIRIPNVESLSVVLSPVSSFGFRHSSFGFENCSLFYQKAGQRTGESGLGWLGSGIVSRHSFPAPQAPFGDETKERKQKHGRAMPQRHGPAFGDGCFAVRQTRGERVKFVHRDDFAAGL